MAVQLSEKETNLLALAWQCFEEPPKVFVKHLAFVIPKESSLLMRDRSLWS